MWDEKLNSTGSENLRVYKLAEEIADIVWDIVGKWDRFAKDTVDKQLVKKEIEIRNDPVLFNGQ